MSYSAAVFDRDGVLAYFDADRINQTLIPLLPVSVQTLVHRWETWGAIHGFPSSLEDERATVNDFWEDLGVEYGLSVETTNALQQIDYTTFLQPFPDARPALEHMRSQGLRIGVLSNFTLASLDRSLAAVGLIDLVDVACAATAIRTSKPEPASYRIVADRLGVSPSDCLYFDDEHICVLGAMEVGMNAYLVDRVHNDFEHATSIRTIDGLSSILEIFPDNK